MKSGNRRIQYLAASCVALASFCLGATSTWPTPVLPKYKANQTDVRINDHEVAWLMALNAPGFLFGSFVTGYSADKVGRINTILASAMPMLIASLIAVIAVQPWPLYITRILWGCGTGMIGMTVSMYIAEIADKDIRGTLMSITRVWFNLGSLLMVVVGPFVSYTVINACLLALPVCYLTACLFISDSPHFYLKDGNVGKARKALKKFRGIQDQKMLPRVLEEELTTLQAHVRNDMRRSTTYRELFTGKAYRKAIVIAIGLKTTQVMIGSVTITQYLGRIMDESKANISLPTVMLVFGAVKFVVELMSTVLVDRIGRRPLLFFSCLVYGISLTFVAMYFIFKDIIGIDSAILGKFGFVPFVGILIAIVVNSLGIATIVFLIPGEIFPLNVKAVAMSSLNIYVALLSFVVAHSYQFIKDYAGLHGVFLFFSVVAYGGSAFVFFKIPETKGKSLNEILVELQGPYYTSGDRAEKEDVTEAVTELAEDEKIEVELTLMEEKVTKM